MSTKKTTKKKATKKKATKKASTKKDNEEIPAPLGATAPDLSERIPEVENKREKQPPYNKAFQAVCGLPGLSAKQKSQIHGVMKENWGKNKAAFIESIVNIKGLKQKQKVIQKTLESVL